MTILLVIGKVSVLRIGNRKNPNIQTGMGTLTKKVPHEIRYHSGRRCYVKRKNPIFYGFETKKLDFLQKQEACLPQFIFSVSCFFFGLHLSLYFPRFQLICLYGIYISCCQYDTFFPIIFIIYMYIYIYMLLEFSYTLCMYTRRSWLNLRRSWLNLPLIKGKF